ncbi:MAG: hypothetical protein QFB87_01200 [Patescibacteria group bacterium]|nr:hypothetical protein [Patescibacteria group bacterium]
MHEAGPVINQEQLLEAKIYEDHGNDLLNVNGQQITLNEYRELADMLCPVPASQRTAGQNLERVAGLLTENNVVLREEYTAYVPKPPEADRPATDNKHQEKISHVKADATVQTEKATKQPNVQKVVLPTIELAEAVLEPARLAEQVARRQLQARQQEIIQQLVSLAVEKPSVVVQAVLAAKTPVTGAFITAERAPKVVAVPAATKTTEVRADSPKSVVFESSLESPAESTALQNLVSEITLDGLTDSLEEFAVPVSNELGLLDYGEMIESDIVTSLPATVEAVDSTTVFVTQEHTAELVEQTPQVIIETFLSQVLPALAEALQEQIADMAPEAAAEIVAQVELITVVADRLHVLVISGQEAGEEAQQIEVFLAREYEQLLVALGIEPTKEMMTDFIHYIYSETYNLQPEVVLSEADIFSEGTHEKKLFDEQSVFAKAQLASVRLGQGIGSMIGRVAVTNLAA